jgi:Exodeoxyribonuclease VII small subunit (EC 3.1.11.6)
MAEKKFEEALKELEEIVRKMESGDLTLEESLKSFEEGVRLSRFCSKRLDEAERRIEVLLKNEEGLVDIKPFRESDDDIPF